MKIEKYLDKAFELSILIKGFLALLEILGGLTLFLLNNTLVAVFTLQLFRIYIFILKLFTKFALFLKQLWLLKLKFQLSVNPSVK